MPIGAYFEGKGNEVMSSMKRTYTKKLGQKRGLEKAKRVFYAKANKENQTPK